MNMHSCYLYYEKAKLKISDAKASSHPLLKLYRSILDCYQNIQEKASIIRHVQLNVSSMEDAQGLVIKILKQLATLQHVLNQMEIILPVEIANCKGIDDIDIDSDDEEYMAHVLGRDMHVSSDHTEPQVYDEKPEVEETASDLFDDDTESVATDYEEGLAAFSGEYLQGLEEEDKIFWRKLEFDYNTALWQKLDYRDVRKFEEIDEFLDAMDKAEVDEDVVENYDKVVSSDKINVDEDNEEHQDDGVESDWYEDLHEEDVALLDSLDAQLAMKNPGSKQETTYLNEMEKV